MSNIIGRTLYARMNCSQKFVKQKNSVELRKDGAMAFRYVSLLLCMCIKTNCV